MSPLLFIALLLTSSYSHATILIKGNEAAVAGTTFSFPVQQHVTNASSEHFYVGARNVGAQGFALSGLSVDSDKFFALAPEKVTLNREKDQDNPLFNAAITHLDIISLPGTPDRPVAVIGTAPANIYLIDDVAKQSAIQVFSAVGVKDASGAVNTSGAKTSGVVALQGVQTPETQVVTTEKKGKGSFATVNTVSHAGVVAAVKPANGDFGQLGGGIALLSFGLTEVPCKDGTISKVSAFFQVPTKPEDRGVKAVPLDVTSAVVKIKSNLADMTNVVAFHWDPILQRIYIGLQVTGDAGATDGAQAIVVGRINKGKLLFSKIAPSSIFTAGDNNEIVGGINANAQVSVHALKTLRANSNFPYLIVLGGNGDPATTQRSVFALPLVKNIRQKDKKETINPAIVGVLADKNSDNTKPAKAPDQIYTNALTSANSPALVGGGPLEVGDIDDLIVSQETVFAVVSNATAGQVPGIFYSQALLEPTGQIKTWTEWQRVAGIIDPVFGAAYDPKIGNFTAMFGADANDVNIVRRTVWGSGTESGLKPLVDQLSVVLPKFDGGIQGLADFARSTPGLNNISMLVATGLGSVVLAETGQQQSGEFLPTAGNQFEAMQQFQNGALTANAKTNIISLSGGVLAKLGPIVTAEIGVSENKNQGFLFVGGVYGLAVLSKADNTGWNTATGLGNQFAGLTNGMSFKKIGNYRFVRKLIYDQDADGNSFLYVLTDTQLDRLDLNKPKFPATILATLNDPIDSEATFLDLIVSGKLALLATSRGLFRTGNNHNIQLATSPADVAWQIIKISDKAGPVIELTGIAATDRQQDFARGKGGNVYALSGYIGKDRGQVVRLAVNGVASSPINDETVQQITTTRLVNFGDFRDTFVTDGALCLDGQDKSLGTPLVLFAGCSKEVGVVLDFVGGNAIARIVREATSGCWLVAGDFGLRVNE